MERLREFWHRFIVSDSFRVEGCGLFFSWTFLLIELEPEDDKPISFGVCNPACPVLCAEAPARGYVRNEKNMNWRISVYSAFLAS